MLLQQFMLANTSDLKRALHLSVWWCPGTIL